MNNNVINDISGLCETLDKINNNVTNDISGLCETLDYMNNKTINKILNILDKCDIKNIIELSNNEINIFKNILIEHDLPPLQNISMEYIDFLVENDKLSNEQIKGILFEIIEETYNEDFLKNLLEKIQVLCPKKYNTFCEIINVFNNQYYYCCEISLYPQIESLFIDLGAFEINKRVKSEKLIKFAENNNCLDPVRKQKNNNNKSNEVFVAFLKNSYYENFSIGQTNFKLISRNSKLHGANLSSSKIQCLILFITVDIIMNIFESKNKNKNI